MNPNLYMHRDPGNGRVHVNGLLTQVCTVSNGALERLAHLASDGRIGDCWTARAMLAYLKYTFLKQLSMENVLIVDARQAAQDVQDALKTAGVSQVTCIFNTGLTDPDVRPIYAMLVQDLPPAEHANPPGGKRVYLLVAEHISAGMGHPALEALAGVCGQLGVVVTPAARPGAALGLSLPAPQYVAQRSPDLLFDTSLHVEKNARHLVRQQAGRLVVAGALDLKELCYQHVLPGTPAPTPPAAAAGQESFAYARLVDENKPEKPAVLDEGQEVFLLHRNNKCRFRRQEAGLNSASKQLSRWIDESTKLCRRNFNLVVPMVHFTVASHDNRFDEHTLLLLPLFCGLQKPVLALTLLYREPAEKGQPAHYEVDSVLTLRVARSSARLLTTLQAQWLGG